MTGELVALIPAKMLPKEITLVDTIKMVRKVIDDLESKVDDLRSNNEKMVGKLLAVQRNK